MSGDHNDIQEVTTAVTDIKLTDASLQDVQNHRAPRNSKHRHKQRNKPKSEGQDTKSDPINGSQTPKPVLTEAHISSIVSLENDDNIYWKVQAVFSVNNKFYIHVVHKILNARQIESFEDSRVEDAVMRGQKIPSKDEHWKVLYRKELKSFQCIFGNNTWVYDVLPDKKYKSELLWGSYPSKPVALDPDSQVFFLHKYNKKLQAKKNYKECNSDELPVFG